MPTLGGGCTVDVDSDGIARIKLDTAGSKAFLAPEDDETEGDTQFENDEKSRKLAEHSEGRCTPCLFVAQYGDCRRGDACAYCHFCTREDFIQRKKATYSRLKQEAKANGTWNLRKKGKA
eukprot:TRINITY_DN9706_c0_g3_i1.p1 TRINITY_DN9706_c0_g3~~TRINITY_DN9706_c0_g3_i1.p1  ORF type:complete len:141 (-),score=27.92 TRINITY_DN9706_c0_g3_i1:154-513(-)